MFFKMIRANKARNTAAPTHAAPANSQAPMINTDAPCVCVDNRTGHTIAQGTYEEMDSYVRGFGLCHIRNA